MTFKKRKLLTMTLELIGSIIFLFMLMAFGLVSLIVLWVTK